MRALFLASGPSEYEKKEVFFHDFHAWIHVVGPTTCIFVCNNLSPFDAKTWISSGAVLTLPGESESADVALVVGVGVPGLDALDSSRSKWGTLVLSVLWGFLPCIFCVNAHAMVKIWESLITKIWRKLIFGIHQRLARQSLYNSNIND